MTIDQTPRNVSPSPAAACVALLALAGCLGFGKPAPDGEEPNPLEPRVTLRTTRGDITIALHEQMVPLTVDNFLKLVASGYYNGTRVDRIVKGYDIQMGDPAAHKGDATPWTGGSLGHTIPDEFHPALRHDRAGMVSMATSGPDAGNAEFFITTGPAPGYDDRYSLFGHVVSGMDVVHAIEDLPVSGEGTEARPLETVAILGATLERPRVPDGAAQHGVRLQTTTASKLAAANHSATFVLLVTNTGNVRDTYTLAATAPAGWGVAFEGGNPRVALPAGRGWAVLLHVTPPSGALGPGGVEATARSEADPAKSTSLALAVRLGNLGAPPRDGQAAVGNYTGFLQDGRVFDTTLAAIGGDTSFVKMSSVFTRTAFEPYAFLVGQGDVAGFAALARQTAVGESRVGRVPWDQGYVEGSARTNPLYHRDLLFELQVDAVGPAPA